MVSQGWKKGGVSEKRVRKFKEVLPLGKNSPILYQITGMDHNIRVQLCNLANDLAVGFMARPPIPKEYKREGEKGDWYMKI